MYTYSTYLVYIPFQCNLEYRGNMRQVSVKRYEPTYSCACTHTHWQAVAIIKEDAGKKTATKALNDNNNNNNNIESRTKQ